MVISKIVKLQVNEMVDDVFLFDVLVLVRFLNFSGLSNIKLMMYDIFFFILFVIVKIR